jgi:hypothetical protein
MYFIILCDKYVFGVFVVLCEYKRKYDLKKVLLLTFQKKITYLFFIITLYTTLHYTPLFAVNVNIFMSIRNIISLII